LIPRPRGARPWYFLYMSASFSSPSEAALQLGLKEGDKVADLGAGSGHYARALAAIVGASGTVYAIDIQEDVLPHITHNAHERHRGTIKTLWGDIEKAGGTHLRDASVDAAVIANVLFQAENRFGLLAETKRIVKPGGKLLVVDWAGAYGGMGPAPERVVSEHDAEAFFIQGGFHKVKSFRAGPHHYGILFTAP